MTSRISVLLSGFEPATSRVQAKKRYSLIQLALLFWCPQNVNFLLLIILIL